MNTSNNKEDFNTLVFGASLKEIRASNRVVKSLRNKNFPVIAFGGRSGYIEDVHVETELKNWKNIHTITMYMGEKRQKQFEDFLLSLNPDRIIFNPGAENFDLFHRARNKNIEVLNACTLVMLSLQDY